MNKRKYIFENIPENIKTTIYNYDNTFIILFNECLKELINNYNNKKKLKLKKEIVRILKCEWYCNEYKNYIFPRLNFNIIIKAMKDNIINSIGVKNMKLILRSFCHFNNSDNLINYSDDTNLYPNCEVDDNNEYFKLEKYDGETKIRTIYTSKTIKLQIFNFLQDIICENKLEEFLINFIDDNFNIPLENYILADKYNNIRETFIEDNNTTYIFKNYDFNQLHLYNFYFETSRDDKISYEQSKEQYLKQTAIKLYMKKNGLNNSTTTIQIRYINSSFSLF